MSESTKSPLVTKVLLRQSIGSIRLIIALFVVSAAIIKLLYNHFLPGLIDFGELRWTIIGLGIVFYMATFIRSKRGAIISYFGFLLYLLTLLYVISFVVINQFNPNAVTILILILAASTVIINNLFYYGIQSLVVLVVSFFAYLSYNLDNENLIAFFNLGIAIGVFVILIVVRLKFISSVKNSHANLEKLNVLSVVANKNGEIVFVSPSVHRLLGYEPKELVKDGWWKLRNLQEGWISRDYILNYPNILPKEIELMETKVLAKDGKTVWLSWSNSILSNGNYIGVALDVTKYKSTQG